MSTDFKIQNVCDHKINWESVRLSTSDYRSLSTSYTIGSGGSVRVRINGTELLSTQYDVLFKKNPLDPTLEQRYIRLKKKERSYAPLVEVSYNTERSGCPKCLGGAVLDDFKYGANGDMVTVDKELQLIQLVEKYIVTRIGSNKFHRWVGTDIHGLLGSKIFDFDTIRLEVINQITLAINKLKEIQSQLLASGRKVNEGEIFEELIGVQVDPNDTDPSIVKVLVTFTARSGNILQFEQLLEFGQLRERVAY